MYIAIDIEFSDSRLPDYIELVTGEEAAQWFVGGMSAIEAAETADNPDAADAVLTSLYKGDEGDHGLRWTCTEVTDE